MQNTYPCRSPRKARGLRSDRSIGGPLPSSPRDGQPLACRICWGNTSDGERGEMVTPCDCKRHA